MTNKTNENKTLKVVGAIGAGALLVAAGALGMGIVKSDTIQDQAGQISQLSNANQALVLEDLSNMALADNLKLEIATLTEAVDAGDATIAELEAKVAELEAVEATIVEVQVDNGNLDLVLDHIYDNDGRVNYLLDDLKDDEVDQVVDRVVFINDVSALAVAEVKAEFLDIVDKEDQGFGAKFFDEDDVERVRVGDIIYFDVDFEDSDADVTVFVNFEQDNVKYVAEVEVEIKDGEVEDTALVSINLRP